MVELSLGRNDPTGAWVYPPPPDLSPQNLDWTTWLNDAPKIPFNPERFARWRCWKEYGTGVGGDLMVHLALNEVDDQHVAAHGGEHVTDDEYNGAGTDTSQE